MTVWKHVALIFLLSGGSLVQAELRPAAEAKKTTGEHTKRRLDKQYALLMEQVEKKVTVAADAGNYVAKVEVLDYEAKTCDRVVEDLKRLGYKARVLAGTKVIFFSSFEWQDETIWLIIEWGD